MEFLEFYLPNADLFHGTLNQELVQVKDSPLKYFFVIDTFNKTIGCFALKEQSIGYFVLLVQSNEIFNEMVTFWKSNIKETINLSTSSRYLENFLDLVFIFKYSRYRMVLDLNKFDGTNCTLNNFFHNIQKIQIDSVTMIESIVKLIFEANEQTLDQKIFNRYALDLEQETKLLYDIFHSFHEEFRLIEEVSFCYQDSYSHFAGVILITEYLGTHLIYDLAVFKNFQGKKIGSNLICSSIKALQSTSYTKLALYVTKGNSNAEHIYTKLQFASEEFDFCQLELNS